MDPRGLQSTGLQSLTRLKRLNAAGKWGIKEHHTRFLSPGELNVLPVAASVTRGRLGLQSQEGQRKGGTACVGGWGGGHPALLPRKAGFPGNELERTSWAVCHSTASCQHAHPAAPGFLAGGLPSVTVGGAGAPPQGSRHEAGVRRARGGVTPRTGRDASRQGGQRLEQKPLETGGLLSLPPFCPVPAAGEGTETAEMCALTAEDGGPQGLPGEAQ